MSREAGRCTRGGCDGRSGRRGGLVYASDAPRQRVLLQPHPDKENAVKGALPRRHRPRCGGSISRQATRVATGIAARSRCTPAAARVRAHARPSTTAPMNRTASARVELRSMRSRLVRTVNLGVAHLGEGFPRALGHFLSPGCKSLRATGRWPRRSGSRQPTLAASHGVRSAVI